MTRNRLHTTAAPAKGQRWHNRKTKRIATITDVGRHVIEYRYDGGNLLSMPDKRFLAGFEPVPGAAEVAS